MPEAEETEAVEESTEIMETETEETTPTYTYTDKSATMYAQRSVNVRSLPSTDGEKLGALSQNQEVTVTGQCNETGWYRIEFNGEVGYVSNNYLGDSQVEVQEAPTDTGNTDTSANNGDNEVCPYSLYTMYYDNMGYPYFYGKWGGSANMDADNYAWTESLISQMNSYLWENFHTKEDGYENRTHNSSCSWQSIGRYQGMQVVVRYIASIDDVTLPSPEERGIPTAGNGIWISE